MKKFFNYGFIVLAILILMADEIPSASLSQVGFLIGLKILVLMLGFFLLWRKGMLYIPR